MLLAGLPLATSIRALCWHDIVKLLRRKLLLPQYSALVWEISPTNWIRHKLSLDQTGSADCKYMDRFAKIWLKHCAWSLLQIEQSLQVPKMCHVRHLKSLSTFSHYRLFQRRLFALNRRCKCIPINGYNNISFLSYKDASDWTDLTLFVT